MYICVDAKRLAVRVASRREGIASSIASFGIAVSKALSTVPDLTTGEINENS
ncbi:MAG: hypothetical protein RMY16_15700 [Nostoc sp. DedQUE12b]|uniref:hypothetical protein n=1 Tax=unclassified Nostoc TaxID=2593658 RepID=UPI002AD2F331|nr:MULTISPECIES: hypothetical protein [unclassified Nostoc]MDZ7951715.1 hypothetical protein [Nostoc sp. DedQUE09]MDZ8086983.1 hypothetical protein [Nostoc sp. DedQUE12b]